VESLPIQLSRLGESRPESEPVRFDISHYPDPNHGPLGDSTRLISEGTYMTKTWKLRESEVDGDGYG